MKNSTMLYIDRTQNESIQLGILKEAYPDEYIYFAEAKNQTQGIRNKETLHCLIELLSEKDKIVICSNDVISKYKRTVNQMIKSMDSKGIELEILDN